MFHCPSCDGYEARDADVVVFGWSEEVAGFALELLNWAARVTIVTDGRDFQGGPRCRTALARNGVELCVDEALELTGPRGDLRAVRLRGGATIPCQLAFFSIAHHPRSDLAGQLGCELVAAGGIRVDEQGQTSVPGVYAAGDVTPGLQLAQVAAASGAVAGASCAMSLRGDPLAGMQTTAGPDPAQELTGTDHGPGPPAAQPS